ncbi:hypothetical protein ABIB25_000171 [Nakamurella sp. UYEF19]|uniref:hypothetical protein n=1 Tax=Nakamurella sp. UYEF19 TaxID=1756392 RepID=UPI0033916570
MTTPEPDAVMAQVGRGIELSQRGEKRIASEVFSALWAQVGPDGDPVHRCAIAHWTADLQDDVHRELMWDLRALEAAESISDHRVLQAGVGSSVLVLFPSLHLNLREAYRKLGDHHLAADHAAKGRAACAALGDDGYGRMIGAGLERLQQRLTDQCS